jgi:hypothetical protein
LAVRIYRTPTEEDVMTTDPAPAKKVAPRKAKAAPAKPEYAPTVTDKGRLDHSTCGHPRTPAGRAACRAARAEAGK